jgi:hypothetical protein
MDGLTLEDAMLPELTSGTRSSQLAWCRRHDDLALTVAHTDHRLSSPKQPASPATCGVGVVLLLDLLGSSQRPSLNDRGG